MIPVPPTPPDWSPKLDGQTSQSGMWRKQASEDVLELTWRVTLETGGWRMMRIKINRKEGTTTLSDVTGSWRKRDA